MPPQKISSSGVLGSNSGRMGNIFFRYVNTGYKRVSNYKEGCKVMSLEELEHNEKAGLSRREPGHVVFGARSNAK